MSDLDQIVGADSAPEPEAIEEPVVEAVETPPEPEAPEPEVTPEAAETPPEPVMVPLAVVNELRDEIRALKAAPQPQAAPEPAPDFFDDPQGAVQHAVSPVKDSVESTKLAMSKFFAEDKFGKDLVADAMAYYDQNPAQSQAFMNHPSPFHAAVEAYQQVKVAQEIGSDPAAYEAKLRERLEKEIKAELVAQQVKTAAGNPAPSLANTTGTGGGPKTTWAGPASLESVVGQ